MPQIYLLSILANVVAGLTLSGDYLGSKFSLFATFKNLSGNRTAQVIIGIVTLVVGALKIFILSPRESVPVAGDLLPALTGIVLGAALLVEASMAKIEGGEEKLGKLSKAVLGYRVPLGIFGVIVGILHFLFPGTLIL
jgi:hypothetical protein